MKGDMGEEQVISLKGACEAKSKQFQEAGLLAAKREVQLHFMKVTWPITFSDVGYEWEVLLAAQLKDT
eukprot:2772533-Lingulodinium_polyedra.AAC.1